MHGLGSSANVNDRLSNTSHPDSDVITENYNNHHEALPNMQRQQQEQVLRQQTNQLDRHSSEGAPSYDLDHSFVTTTAPGGVNGRTRFTLDTATAQFAVSAVRTSTDGLQKGGGIKDPLGIGSDNKRRRLDHSSVVGGGKNIVQQNGPVARK